MGSSMASQTDTQLHDSVQMQLEWDPEIDADDIAVAASDGVITLTGTARRYSAKLKLEQSVKRVRGVRGVVNEIQVRPLDERVDMDIEKDAVHALRAHATVPISVTVTARKGILTLEGPAQWMFQKTAAAAAVAHLSGVIGVSNQIVVAPSISVGQVKTDIDAALLRCADVDARHVTVTIDGPIVTLSGQVSSCHERQEAEGAAWGAPGINRVENQIVVGASRESRDPLRRSTCSAGCARKSAV